MYQKLEYGCDIQFPPNLFLDDLRCGYQQIVAGFAYQISLVRINCKINFGRPIDNKFSSLDHMSHPQSIHPEIECLHYCSSNLSLSSLLTPNALGVPISLNTERKSLSLTSIQILKSKPNLYLSHSKDLGLLPGLSKDISTVFLSKIAYLPILFIFFSFSCIFIHFIVIIYFYSNIMIFMVTCFLLLLIRRRSLKESKLCNCLVLEKPLRLMP